MTSVRIRIPRFLLTTLLLLVPAVTAHAQSQATPEGDMPHPMMIATTADDLPLGEAEVWFFRLVLDPGAQIPTDRSMGPVLVVVQAGSVRLNVDRAVSLTNVTGGDAPFTPVASGSDVVLGPDQGAFIAGGTSLGIDNTGNGHATLLVLSVLSSQQEPDEAATPVAASSGVLVERLSGGHMALDNQSGILVIERDIVRPNGSAVSSTFHGIEVGVVDQGSAHVTFQTGTNRVRPGSNTSLADLAPAVPVPIDPGARVTLSTNDGYTSVGGSLVWRADGLDTLVVIRAQVIPIPLPS